MRDLVFGGLTMYFFPGSPDPKSLNADDREHSAYRQLCPALRSHGLSVLGISSQPLREQEDALLRNEVQHPLVLDPDLEFADALGLPTFLSGGHRYSERLTLLVLSGRVAHVFHPIDRPDRNPEQVLTWMLAHAG
jgi:peroxiredoxin